MLIIGLTGSIGTGKSTAAARFRTGGIAVSDADAIVHALYDGEAVPFVEVAFPGVTFEGRVDRGRLAAALVADPGGFARLEVIVHPLVRKAQRAFLQYEKARGARIAVLEVPLLFETGADALVDVTVVTSASRETQRARVLARPGMTSDKLDTLLARQIPDGEKLGRADFVVDTNGSIADSEVQVDAIIMTIEGRAGHAYHRDWVVALE